MAHHPGFGAQNGAQTGVIPNTPAEGVHGIFHGGASVGRPAHIPGRGPDPAAFMNALGGNLEPTNQYGAQSVGTRLWGPAVNIGHEIAYNMRDALYQDLNALLQGVMPLREHNTDTLFKYTIEMPDAAIMANVPETAPAPRVSDRTLEQGVSLKRHAIGMSIDSSAMINTPYGRRLFKMKMDQIRSSVLRRMLLVIYGTLQNSANAAGIQAMRVERTDRWQQEQRENAAIDTFGILQREDNGFLFLEGSIKQFMDTMGTKPDVAIMSRTTATAARSVPAMMEYSRAGPDKTPIRDIAGAPKVSRTAGGLPIIAASSFPVESGGENTDLMSRAVAIGGIVPFHANNGNWKVGIEDETHAMESQKTVDEALFCTQSFDKFDHSLLVDKIDAYIKRCGDSVEAARCCPLVSRVYKADGTIKAVPVTTFGAMDPGHLTPIIMKQMCAGTAKVLGPLSAQIMALQAFIDAGLSARMTQDVQFASQVFARHTRLPGGRIEFEKTFGVPNLEHGLKIVGDDSVTVGGEEYTKASMAANTAIEEETTSAFPHGYHTLGGMFYLESISDGSAVYTKYKDACDLARKAAAAWAPVYGALSSTFPNSYVSEGVDTPFSHWAAKGSAVATQSLAFNALVAHAGSPVFVATKTGGGQGMGPGMSVAGKELGDAEIRAMASVEFVNGKKQKKSQTLLSSGFKMMSDVVATGFPEDGATKFSEAMTSATASGESYMWLNCAMAAFVSANNRRIGGTIGTPLAVALQTFSDTIISLKNNKELSARRRIDAVTNLTQYLAAGIEACLAAGTTSDDQVRILGAMGDVMTLDQLAKPLKFQGGNDQKLVAGNDDVFRLADRLKLGTTSDLEETTSFCATPLMMSRFSAQDTTERMGSLVTAVADDALNRVYACGADPGQFPLYVPMMQTLMGKPDVAGAHFAKHRIALQMGADAAGVSGLHAPGSHWGDAEDNKAMHATQRGLLASNLGEAYGHGAIAGAGQNAATTFGMPVLARMRRDLLVQVTSGAVADTLTYAWTLMCFNSNGISAMLMHGVPTPFDIVLVRPNRMYNMKSVIFAQNNAGVTLHAHTVFKASDSVVSTTLEGVLYAHFAAAVLRPQCVYHARDVEFSGYLGGASDVFYEHPLPVRSFEEGRDQRAEETNDTGASMYAAIVPVGVGDKTIDLSKDAWLSYQFRPGASCQQPRPDSTKWSADTTRTTVCYPEWAKFYGPDGSVQKRCTSGPLGAFEPEHGRRIRSGRLNAGI